MASKSYRTLGNNVIPSNYNLKIEPDLAKFEYFGAETIDVSVRKKTRSIKLNSKKLDILKAIVSFKKEQEARIKKDEKNEEITLSFPTPVSGTGKIYLEFSGKNDDSLTGFYRSKYRHGDKAEYILTTHFEPIDARSAFPCFDEPAMKATFEVELIVDRDLQAVSNMPAKVEAQAGDKKIVRFERTPKMSTYLLYMGVGRFEIAEKAVGDVKLRILTTSGKKHLTNLALEYGEKFLLFFEDYFRIRYPLPKIDFIAVPDFAMAAMENWGAITFREIVLLGDENTSVRVKERIAETIAHELAHQWFGNLVTMKWWDDLWLNESFATYMAYKALDATMTDWGMGLRYFENVISLALSADSLKSTHPINMPIKDARMTNQIFDRVSYEKGGSVLFMLENYVGKGTFQLGLHKYLKGHSYGSATKEDLWTSIQNVSDNKSIGKIMNAWINKSGYPIVHVERSQGGYSLRQKRYTLLADIDDGAWPIPITYKDSKNEVGNLLMDKRSQQIQSKSPWIKLNVGQTCFYRTRYSDDILKQFGGPVKNGEIGALGTWGIENDLFSFTRSGRISVLDYLNFVENYCMDADYPLNISVSGSLGWLYMMCRGQGVEKIVERVSMAFHESLLKRVGWERKKDESNIAPRLRAAAIASLGELGHEETSRRAIKMFSDFIAGETDIDTNIRGAVYRITAANGNMKTFETIVERFKRETLPEENRKLLMALGHFNAPTLVSRALEFSQSPDVRLQDSLVITSVVSGNRMCCNLIWPWIKPKWKSFMDRYDEGTHMLDDFVESLSYVSDPKIRKEISDFFKKKSNRRNDIEMPIKQVLERIEANIKFAQKNSSLMSSRSA